MTPDGEAVAAEFHAARSEAATDANELLGHRHLLSMDMDMVGEACARFLCPALFISIVCNQQTWSPVLLALGRVAFWVAAIAAAGMILWIFKARGLVVALAVAMLVTRFARIQFGEAPVPLFLYHGVLAVLFATAGAALVLSRPRVLYRQVIGICAISVPLMIVQILGIADWSQALRTDIHNPILRGRQYPTLFVPTANLVPTTVQARPAGMMYANNAMSLVIMIGLALQHGLAATTKVTRNDLILTLVSILAMAKIVFAMLIALSVHWIFVGPIRRRFKAVKIVALVLLLLALYSVFFPGLFALNLSPQMVYLNVAIRWADFKAAFTGGPMDAIILRNSAGEFFSYSIAARQSGYATIAGYLPFVGFVALLLVPSYRRGLRVLRRVHPRIARLPISLLIVMLLAPIITSPLEGMLYWLAAGGAMLPIIIRLLPYPEGRFQRQAAA